MKYDIPGLGQLEIETLILDLNGTLSVAGAIPAGVKEQLDTLRRKALRFYSLPAILVTMQMNLPHSWVLNGN